MSKSLAQRINADAARTCTPLSVVVELTYQCNQRCEFCFQSAYPAMNELTTSQWINIFDQLAANGSFYSTITGGEPMIRTDFFEITEHARSKGFALSIITNGSCLDTDSAKRLFDLGIMDIGISFLASTPALHDRLTGVEGSFYRAMNALQTAKDAGLQVIIKHTVASSNQGAYCALKEFAEKQGALFECDTLVFPSNAGSVSPYCLSPEKHGEVMKDLGITSTCKGTIESDTSDESLWRLHCDAGRSVCGIRPDGSVVPCIMLPLPFGNLCTNSFTSIWTSDTAKAFRDLEATTSESCIACSKKEQCVRCHAVAFWEKGDWKGCSPSLYNRCT